MKPHALLVAAGGIFFACSLATQEPSRGPDGHSRTSVPGVEVLAIPGRPFTAKTTTEWTRTLEDGSTITMRLDAVIARDRQGRVYRENHTFVPLNSKGPAPLYQIHLYDPVSRSQLRCDGRVYECLLSEYKPKTYFDATPEGSYENDTRTLTRAQLGSDTIEGIHVTGTRETWTTLPGAAGNESPIVSTREYWYSEELQTNLAVTRIDPGTGKQVIRLSQISRDEPDPHLWDAPIGFKVLDTRAAAQRRR
jgi:hypothetical protein